MQFKRNEDDKQLYIYVVHMDTQIQLWTQKSGLTWSGNLGDGVYTRYTTGSTGHVCHMNSSIMTLHHMCHIMIHEKH